MPISSKIFKTLILAGLASALAACGGDKSDQSAVSMDCPPPPSKPGLSAIKYTKWQTKIPPKSCAGSLAPYVPDLPPGYGVPPNVRPPIMMEGHVYFKYVEIPEGVTGDALEMINFAQLPQFEYEIVQITPEQASTFKNWMESNPDRHTDFVASGRTFTAMGGGGWYLPGNKLTGGIGVILGNNVLIKFSMPKMYADNAVPQPVAQMFHEIAVKNGQ